MQRNSIVIDHMHPPQDDLYKQFDKYVQDLKNGDIIFVSSKVVAIHEGNCVRIPPNHSDAKMLKKKLIAEEAEKYLDPNLYPNEYNITLAIKHHALFASAGIDESNANGYFILLPKNPFHSAFEIYRYFINRFGLKSLGVVILDSHTTPMRRGTMGISIGFAGLKPLKDYTGTPDIFGRELQYTKMNRVDAYAAFANVLMGEGNESTPFVIGRELPCEFLPLTDANNQQVINDFRIDQNVDIYHHLFRNFKK